MPTEERLVLGNLQIDLQTHQVWVDRQEVILTRKELSLLVYLITHRGKVLAVAEIEHNIWNGGLADPSASVRILMHRLRRKLQGFAPYQIRTVGGLGYSLVSAKAPEHTRSQPTEPQKLESAS